MPGTLTAEQISRARPDPARYALLCLQLAVLAYVFHALHLESPVFFALAVIVFAGFAVHYWVPPSVKEGFLIALSLAGAFILLEPLVAGMLVASGLLLHGILKLPLAYGVRVSLAAGFVASMFALRGLHPAAVPEVFWMVFGGVFMFRLAIYLYDLRHRDRVPGFREFASYFFILPNFYFHFFPVVDYQTMRKSYFRRDIHDVAQQGMLWMVRGTIQLLLYRLIVHFRGAGTPDLVTGPGSLAQTILLTYLLYLQVSGQFHIIVGMLHLFGYDLPETHRRFLLSRSLTDFWRRINIYWKDFMVKMVYFPVYFRMRRSGELRAQIVATAVVFVTTWALHVYQYFWLTGRWLLTWPDALFWALLGGLVIANVVVEVRRSGTPQVRGIGSHARRGLQVAATLTLISLLWSMWNAPTLRAWLDLLTFWEVG